MTQSNAPQGGNRGGESQGVRVLATVGSGVTAFFGTGPLQGSTIAFVQAFARDHYGYGFDDIVNVAWWGVCAVGVYGAARMVSGVILRILEGRGLLSGFRIGGGFR
ncbi:hypothetical protein [Thalassobaculum litoreum]|uniref:Uncharacterized protein n=1 Tax=Thalassobaculum litoreum DSM 18839 TaxID=1123362 RepID=A0A8G2BIV9_9PROT|nr:hypothetical protein [Thalassobaculum litoreum]SDF61705.1 hypothetical protein SAMN05660686_01781 [Thalassobaculum litoreum DSM 18839]